MAGQGSTAAETADVAFKRVERRGYALENPFGGATSFLRRAYAEDLSGVDVAVFGVPFDAATTNRPGARFGPRAIREASTLQVFDPPFGWSVEPLRDLVVVDHGDVAFDHARIDAFPAVLEAHVATILAAGAAALMLGGDHFVSYPALKAHAAVHGPLSLVQFDAHTDTWPDDGVRIDHGTMMARAVAEGLVAPDRSVQVGIRTRCPDAMGIRVIDADAVHEAGPREIARRIREIVGTAPVYLTFDIDALDPAFAPGTGTPVWGGLSSWQASMILRGLSGIRLAGCDVVEVAPPYDATGATAIAGAHVAHDLLCLFAAGRAGEAA